MRFAPEVPIGRRDDDAHALHRWRSWHFVLLFVLGVAFGFVVAYRATR
jgi:hypothetical protein